MSRRRLKSLGALLALASLLVLHLHVLAHVFGHDDDSHDGKAAPCALCQTVLAQHSLAAAPSVIVPGNPGTFTVTVPDEALLCEHFFAPKLNSRGPPRPLFA